MNFNIVWKDWEGKQHTEVMAGEEVDKLQSRDVFIICCTPTKASREQMKAKLAEYKRSMGDI